MNTADLVSTTAIGQAMGFVITVDLLKHLGFEPVVETAVGKYWNPEEVPSMMMALGNYLIEQGNRLEK